MGKVSAVERAIEHLDGEIKVLQLARDRLVAQLKPKTVKSKPRPVPTKVEDPRIA